MRRVEPVLRRSARRARKETLGLLRTTQRALTQRARRAQRRVRGPYQTLAEITRSAGGLVSYSVPGEATACPACGGVQLMLLATLPVSRVLAGRRTGFVTGCRDCGLVFANPLPSAEELRAFYAPEGEWGRARDEEPRREKAPAAPYVLELFRPAREWIDPARPPAGAAVFEFGCGDGELLDALAAFGWATYGLDPGDKRAFPRHRELHGIPGEPTFDAAIAHHVLEHVTAPLEILRALERALKPGGLLLVSVPRLDTVHRHRDFRYCINPRTHVVAYTRDCLATLFAKAGLQPIDGSPPPDAPGDDWFVLRRLRMIGRKAGGARPLPASPLAAARRAIAAYQAVAHPEPRWRLALPVRTRAALSEIVRRL